jgi:peroxiredoxin
LVFIYRGDFDPFSRFELAELIAHADDFRRAGVDIIAISADPVERSKMLAGFLRTKIPLLSDNNKSILAPLGLVQHHRNGEPDNAIPAFFVLDRDGVVRWIFTSPYYRELPRPETLLDAAKSIIGAESATRPAPTTSQQ